MKFYSVTLRSTHDDRELRRLTLCALCAEVSLRAWFYTRGALGTRVQVQPTVNSTPFCDRCGLDHNKTDLQLMRAIKKIDAVNSGGDK